MIRNIVGGQGIVISGSNSNTPYIDMSRPSAGMVRYIANNIEVYDGSSWQVIQNSYPMVELSPDIHELLRWAKDKRDEEYRIKSLVKDNPTLQAAYDQVIKSREQLEILAALVKEHTN